MSNPAAVRKAMVKVHRYVGLTLALFLVIIAGTGCIIAFYDELDRVVNPRLRVVEPRERRWTVPDLVGIREKIEAEDLRVHVMYLKFPQRADDSMLLRVRGSLDPVTGQSYQLQYNEIFANPYTGQRLGERFVGKFSLERQDLISQIRFLHYAFVLPESAGVFFIGILGLIFAVDSCVGFYLTLPMGEKRKAANGKGKSFFHRWKPAWQIKRGAATNRVIYDTHRASGLWLWPLIFIFGISGFALNQGSTYSSVLNSFTDYLSYHEKPPQLPLDRPLVKPPVDWYKAAQLGQSYLAKQAHAQGFELGAPAGLIYSREHGLYTYLSHTSLDLRDGYTPTENEWPLTAAMVAIDGRDGRVVGMQLPTGQHASNTITNWMIALHTTSVFGVVWQIAVSVFGMMVCTITITGVLIWWRKRKARSSRVPARTRNVATPV
ncbi:MAG: PepSY-associated TM helix domain-containing protein [Pseudomonadota bacterium]|jgi:uncharacterized iron-regulated membrane protein